MEKTRFINWESNESIFLMNPKLPAEERQKALEFFQESKMEGHFWIATSGSSSLKWTALSKEAVLISAKAVNQHLQSTAQDIWINPLPDFHVGGLGIEARAFLSGAKVVSFYGENQKWNPYDFHAIATESCATLCSLVPAQVFDLVANGLEAPSSVRALIVGGGALAETLYTKARQLGWNLLPSYGLTECCSQVATAKLDSLNASDFPSLDPLCHITLNINQAGYIEIKSPSLLTCYATREGANWKMNDPKNENWLVTEDKGEIGPRGLTIIGRGSHFVKIGGESVDLGRLDLILQEIKLGLKVPYDIALKAVPDDRLGHVIHLLAAADPATSVESVVDAFQQLVHPFEKIRQVCFVDRIPRSVLGKQIRT